MFPPGRGDRKRWFNTLYQGGDAKSAPLSFGRFPDRHDRDDALVMPGAAGSGTFVESGGMLVASLDSATAVRLSGPFAVIGAHRKYDLAVSPKSPRPA